MDPALQQSLVGFRQELQQLFAAQKRHDATRQQLKDLYVRLLCGKSGTGREEASAPEKEKVGIAGVGRNETSPNSKGARAQAHALSLQPLGGDQAVRRMAAEHLKLEVGSKNSIQDLWADEISESVARVSVLLAGAGAECRQITLEKPKGALRRAGESGVGSVRASVVGSEVW
ncbi:unnamed protein product [Effrenium voratum]|uniref:Uncharacterized protein n=1 Tax=Effrenium voratum TaxID=2562239 RepID=A0AA36NCT2_9DINO|nr:unnamed protein product [Effrenium voratum]